MNHGSTLGVFRDLARIKWQLERSGNVGQDRSGPDFPMLKSSVEGAVP